MDFFLEHAEEMCIIILRKNGARKYLCIHETLHAQHNPDEWMDVTKHFKD
jgi:hypothetical protein